MAEKIEIDVSGALRDIASLTNGLDSLQKKAIATGNTMDSAFDEGFAVGMADALDELQKEYDELRRSSTTLKNALKTATDPKLIQVYTTNVAKLEAGMSRLEKTGKAAGVNLKAVNSTASTGKQVFEGLAGSLTKATIILAVIDAVIQLTKFSVGLSQQISTATRSFTAFTGSAETAGKIVNRLVSTGKEFFIPTDQILQAGKSLLAFGETADELPEVLGRIADISAATGKDFQELTLIYGKARAAGVLYAEDINQLVDAGIPIIDKFAQQLGISNDQVKKLASEGKISFEELQLALFDLTAQGGIFADQSQIQSESVSGAWRKVVDFVSPALQKLGDLGSEVLVGLLNGFVSVTESIIDFGKELIGIEVAKIEVDYTGRDAYEQEKEDRQERDRLEALARKKRLELDKKNAEERVKLERERQNLAIQAMKEGEEKELAIERFRFAALKRELQKYHLDTSEAEEQHQLNLLRIQVQFANERFNEELRLIELRKAQGEFEAKQLSDERAAAKARLESTKSVRESEIDLLEAYNANFIAALKESGVDAERVAEVQIQFDNEIKAQRLRSEIEFQEALLGQIDQGDQDAITRAKNSIAKLKAQLEGLTIGTPGGGQGFDLKSILGLNDDQIAGLEDSIGRVIDLFGELADARVKEAEAQVRAAEKSTDAAQAYYDEQYQLNEDGFANDLDLANRRLASAKIQEEQALEQKKKAQRQQIILESALQAANIATAASSTLRTFNGPLLPIGIALVAAMIGAFVAAKAKALQATRFKEGGEGRVDGTGIIVGRSHAQGGVKFEAEGGEFMGTDGKRFGIVNKKMTAKHFDLLQAVNRDDKLAMRRIIDGMASPINKQNVLSASGGVVVVGGGISNDTHKLLSDWRNESKVKETVAVAGGYLIRKRGNFTKKTRIA